MSSVLYRREGPIARITLNRPDKLNAINGEMIALLHQALDTAETDARVRAILLDGAGRAYSAGFDLNAGSGDIQYWRGELRKDFDLIMRFWDCPKPTIAAVHGYCLGSALEIAVACDVTFAASDCRFGAPEVRFGSGIVALILPWLIGPKFAKELLLSGDDRVSAERARDIGLINRVVANETLADMALAFARELAANDSLAVALTKQAINRGCEIMGMRAALLAALELDAVIESSETPEKSAFNAVMNEQGLKAALAWRKARLDEE